ncbi:uncharacterized protein LOC141618113 [Silene latifolia]|uniref:uncharacterized protein LOC141618113 n=1 Tax=Silene latifolia TaxID=37657 RepID=UPI003D786A45
MFILPKGIVQKVEATCRNFLWDVGTDYTRAPLVAWDKVCRPKEEGALGLRDMEMWNKALELAAGYSTGRWHEQPEGYSLAGCYRWLRGLRPQVRWMNVVWSPWNIPKTSFMGWLWAHEAMHTKSKLLQYGIANDADCLLCGQATETREHIFFDCVYSRRVIQSLNQNIGGDFPTNDLMDWCLHKSGTKVKKRVHFALVMSTIYQVWQQRNKSRVELVILRPEKLSKVIVQEVRARIRSRDMQLLKKDELEWLNSLNFL